jgi:hypothetical protein
MSIKLKDDWHSRNDVEICSWKIRIRNLLKIKPSAKMWFYEAIYQTWHLKIHALGIF